MVKEPLVIFSEGLTLTLGSILAFLRANFLYALKISSLGESLVNPATFIDFFNSLLVLISSSKNSKKSGSLETFSQVKVSAGDPL